MAKDFNTILSEAQQIKNEIIEGANTALRTGTCLEDIVQRAEYDEANKVDVVAGKGLSTNDYTTTEKNKLAGIAENANNYVHPATHSADILTNGTTNKVYTATEQTKLAGIATGAEVNVQSDWNAVSGDALILNKPTTINGYGITDTYTKTEVNTSLSGKEPTITAGLTSQYWRGDKSWQTLDKSAVGLGSVNNTADADKPISTATQTALNGKAASSHSHAATDITQTASYRFVTDTEKATWNGKQAALGFTPENVANKNQANGYAGLGSDGKIDYSLLPAIAITDTFVCTSQAEMLALTAQRGDVCARSDVSLTYILQGNDPSILSNWQQILAPTGTTGLVQSVNSKVGVVVIDKYDVGLGNVDNTSDLNKPLSTAAQTALGEKVDKVTGKQLSSEDFTADFKNKLEGIEPNAEVNVNPDWSAIGGKSEILNKPNISALTKKTLVANLTSASYFKFAETSINPLSYMAHFRITVESSTTTIGHILDLWIFGNGENAPLLWAMSNTKSTTAATTGIYNIRCIYPKTLNNGYNVQFELAANNTTARDIKVELISATNVVLTNTLIASAPNATYQNTGTVFVVGYDGFVSSGTVYANVSGNVTGNVSGSAGNAGSTALLTGSGSYTAGEALIANDLIFLGTDLKWYKVNTASKTIPLGTIISSCGATYALNATVSTNYLQGFRTLPTGTIGVKNTAKDLYIRGTLSGTSLITDGYLTTELGAGYSYIRIGSLITSTLLNMDGNNRIITIGSNSNISALDGLKFNASSINSLSVETSVPTAGQFLTVNSSATGLEWITNRDKGVNTVTTLASLPITKRLITATVTAATTISLLSDLSIGDELHIIVYNSSASAITQTLPNTGSYISLSGTSISIPATGRIEINILCYATTSYLIRAV